MKLPHTSFPLTYFTSTAIFVDDDSSFLEDQKNLFEKKGFNANIKTFPDPDQALKDIQTHHTDVASTCLNLKESYPGSRNFDLVNQFKNAFNTNCVSLVIVDFAMPPKDGVTFAKELREIAPDIKILMLTGEADESVAINAFNEGTIDGFVKKESEGLGKLILESAQKLTLQYFTEQTNQILGNINPEASTGLPQFLNAKEAVKHFLTQIDFSQIKSFSLQNERGFFEINYKNGMTKQVALLSVNEYQNELEYLAEFMDESEPAYIDAANKKNFPVSTIKDQTLPIDAGSVDQITLNQDAFIWIQSKDTSKSK